MGRFEYTAQHDQSLGGDINFDNLLEDTPSDFSVKGMFMSSIANELSSRVWKDLQTSLETPPRFGRYVPFSDYPVRDFQRVMHALARTKYADVGTREGFRRAGRKAFPTFGESTVGKVMVSVVGDAASALLRYPKSYNLVAKGGLASAQERGPTCISVRWDEYAGSSEFALGLLEGVVVHYGGRPRSQVTVMTNPRVRGRDHTPGWHEIEIEW